MVIGNFFIFFYVLVASLLLYFGFKIFTLLRSDKKTEFIKKNSNKATNGRCPICNSLLMQNDKLISKVYGSLKDKDQRCTVHGCPYCYPLKKNGVSRICPVCGKEIPYEGYLISRLFIRNGKKRHVHIVGCTECNKSRN